MTAPWTSLPLLAVDTETTGVNPFEDRIVEAAVVEVLPDGSTALPWRAVVDPGVEVPAGAAEVHGITTERARAEGTSPARALQQLADRVWRHIDTHGGRAALTMFNARFDWPLILSEAERHAVDFPVLAPILDPYLIDRMADRYRKGKRQLTLVADHYGVELGDAAHGALADATAAGRVMWQIVDRHPAIGEHTLSALWLRQVKGHEIDRQRFVDYMRRTVDKDFDTPAGWPVPCEPERPRKPAAAATDPVPMDEAQNRRVHALLAKARPGQDRHAVLTELLGRPITTAKELSTTDAERVIGALDAEVRAQTATAPTAGAIA